MGCRFMVSVIPGEGGVICAITTGAEKEQINEAANPNMDVFMLTVRFYINITKKLYKTIQNRSILIHIIADLIRP